MESLELIRLFTTNSFFNLWYWLFVAVFWSRITYYSIGVSLNDVRLAYRKPSEGMADFETLMVINVKRYNELFTAYGVVIISVFFFILASVITMGVVYRIEFMFAFALLWGFGGAATGMSFRFAHKLARNPLFGETLIRAYFRHQTAKQILGFFAITLTSIVGLFFMYVI